MTFGRKDGDRVQVFRYPFIQKVSDRVAQLLQKQMKTHVVILTVTVGSVILQYKTTSKFCLFDKWKVCISSTCPM